MTNQDHENDRCNVTFRVRVKDLTDKQIEYLLTQDQTKRDEDVLREEQWQRAEADREWCEEVAFGEMVNGCGNTYDDDGVLVSKGEGTLALEAINRQIKEVLSRNGGDDPSPSNMSEED